jgi:ATP-dependent Clp protease protease subunit
MIKSLTIRFLAPVNQESANTLISIIERHFNQGCKKFKILISSPGGEVIHGISVYNFLKGLDAEIETCNFGSVDSIATVIYCAGSRRFCVPNARFLIHGISFNIKGAATFDEKKMKEIVGGLKKDRENISGIISKACEEKEKKIEGLIFEGTTLNPEEAKTLGLVHEIEQDLISNDDKIIGIG